MALGAQTVFYGTDASVTVLSGMGGLFNAFSIAVTQGITQAAGFGDTWIRSRGTIKSATASVSGFITGGTSNDKPGIAALTRTGGTITGTYFTGCTLAFVGIPTGVATDVQYLGNQTNSYGFQSDGAVVETWVTT